MPWHRKTWSAGFSGFRDNLGKKVAEGKEETEKDCLKCSFKFVQSKDTDWIHKLNNCVNVSSKTHYLVNNVE